MFHFCWCFLDVCNAHYVGKNSGSRYACASSVSLNLHWILVIAVGCKHDDVVASFEMIERMRAVYLAERYLSLSVLEACNKAPMLALFLEFLATCLKVGIKCRKSLPELLYRAFEIIVWHKEMLLHILLFNSVTCFAREDYEFSDYILSAQVYARVRL